jgi:hypothetical protein
MNKNFAFALGALAFTGLTLPALAQDEVSDAVDQALWYGAAYTAVTQTAGMSDDEIAAADAAATAAFTVAVTAMEEDGIEVGEHTRLIDYYVEIAMEDLTNPDAELRYSDAECTALISE